MKNFIIAVKVSRPIFWMLAPPIYYWGAKEAGATISWLMVAEMAMLSFPYCLYLLGLNDWYDISSDVIKLRKKCIGKELIGGTPDQKKLEAIKFSFWLVPLCFLILSILSGRLAHVAPTALLMVLSYIYSAPPRFKCKLFLDSLTNATAFPLIFLMGFTLGGGGQIPSQLWAGFFTVTGVHLCGAILDYKPDSKTGNQTTAVRLGVTTSTLLAITYFLVALFISSLPPAVLISMSVLPIMCVVHLIFKKGVIMLTALLLVFPIFFVFIAHMVLW